MRASPYFIAEVSSNHARDLDRCLAFIREAADIGCDAVKFQLFQIDKLFASEILAKSADHRARSEWELPVAFLPELKAESHRQGLQFSCTPFYMEAVDILEPYVDFYKIASYELLWDDLIIACAETEKPLVLSTGMATLDEVCHAVDVFYRAGGTDLSLLHCISGYPTPVADCNLAAIDTMRKAFGVDVGWSDHSRDAGVIARAVGRYHAPIIEFHLDLDEDGAEYNAGHCWLPDEMKAVIAEQKRLAVTDGTGIKAPTKAEVHDLEWRADPSDGLRPLKKLRQSWQPKQ